jgi:hypothetical protein
MGLTLLFDEKLKRVGIVRWFRERDFNISYPDGKLWEFSFEDFRLMGADVVRQHFREYKVRRVSERDCVPPLPEQELKSYLKGKLPILISWNYSKEELRVSPLKFRRYSLGEFDVADDESVRKLPPGYADTEFWQAIDTALHALQ